MAHQVFDAEGAPLDAHFDISEGDIVFHSRGGTLNSANIRNAQYGPALRLLLDRLNASGRVLTGAWVDSARTQGLPLSDRSIFGIEDQSLAPVELFKRLSAGMKQVGRKPGAPNGGNTTKRIRLQVSPGPGDLAALIAAGDVASGMSPAAAFFQKAETPLVMLADLSQIDKAMADWVGVLMTRARPITSSRSWFAEEAIMLSQSSSSHRSDAVDVELGVRASGAPWTVQLDAPRRAADANGLTAVARNAEGHRFLLRQGRLRANSDSDGEIVGDAFQTLSGLTPVAVKDGSTPQERHWYVVARLDGPPASVRRQTADFVHACARARAASRGLTSAETGAMLFGADEKGGSFFKKATDAKPELEVMRIQGEVLLALRKKLEAAQIVMTKPRHAAGYEVDGVIHCSPHPLLLEVKTGSSASDIYEGVGQLTLYPELLKLKEHVSVLLLPARADAVLFTAVEACGVRVFHYEDRSGGELTDIRFSEGFLELCGAA